MPASLEERVAYLEGRVEEHSHVWRDLLERLDRLEKRVDTLDQRLSARIEALDQRLSANIEALDQRLSARIEALDQRLSARIEALDQKFSRYSLWIIGIQVTVLLSILLILLRS